LAKQSASGGGDFPEAVDRALAEAMEKNWSSAYATRLIFHVCDAPPHTGQEFETKYFNAIKTAAEKGIRIIPVASSGIDLTVVYLNACMVRVVNEYLTGIEIPPVSYY